VLRVTNGLRFYLLEGNNGFASISVFIGTIALTILSFNAAFDLIFSLIWNELLALAIVVVVYCFGLLTQGFVLFRRQFGPVFRWTTYLSLVRYSRVALVLNYYSNDAPLDASGSHPLFGDSTRREFLQLVDVSTESIWQNLVVLLAFTVAFRLLTLAVLLYNGSQVAAHWRKPLRRQPS